MEEEEKEEEEIIIKTVPVGDGKKNSACPVCREDFDQFFKQVTTEELNRNLFVMFVTVAICFASAMYATYAICVMYVIYALHVMYVLF